MTVTKWGLDPHFPTMPISWCLAGWMGIGFVVQFSLCSVPPRSSVCEERLCGVGSDPSAIWT